MCIQSACVNSSMAPTGNCLFGDDVVTPGNSGINLPSSYMTCQATLDYLLSINKSPNYFCRSSLKQICCQTCLKYNAMTCTDEFFDCPKYKSPANCANGQIGIRPISAVSKVVTLLFELNIQLKFSFFFLLCNS